MVGHIVCSTIGKIICEKCPKSRIWEQVKKNPNHQMLWTAPDSWDIINSTIGKITCEEVDVEVERNAEELGSGWPLRRAVRGGRSVVVYFWRKCHWLCIKAGFKKASLINDSFISEVKSRQRWRLRRRGGRLSPPRKLHSKNTLYAFVMLYLKDGPLRRSSEFFAMLL